MSYITQIVVVFVAEFYVGVVVHIGIKMGHIEIGPLLNYKRNRKYHINSYNEVKATFDS